MINKDKNKERKVKDKVWFHCLSRIIPNRLFVFLYKFHVTMKFLIEFSENISLHCTVSNILSRLQI